MQVCQALILSMSALQNAVLAWVQFCSHFNDILVWEIQSQALRHL